jgi:SAM-dependent methyltransferase
MGTSSKSGKLEILSWFIDNEHLIKNILDIGAGSGTYLKLIKEDNEICKDANWVAVEVWPPYIEKFNLQSRYNSVLNVDVRKLDYDQLEKFSVAIAGDVLEHMSKYEAINLVNSILDKCETLIISIPIKHYPQDAVNNNPYEVHVKDDWSHDEVVDTWSKNIINYYVKGKKSDIGIYWLKK